MLLAFDVLVEIRPVVLVGVFYYLDLEIQVSFRFLAVGSCSDDAVGKLASRWFRPSSLYATGLLSN